MNANLTKLHAEYERLMSGLKEIMETFAEVFQEEMDEDTRAQNDYAYNDLTTNYMDAIKKVMAEMTDIITDKDEEEDDIPIAVLIQENKKIATLIKEAKAKNEIKKILEAGKLGGVGDTTIYYLKGKYYLWGDRHRAEGLIKKNKIEGLFKAGNITYTNASYGSKHTEFIPLY